MMLIQFNFIYIVEYLHQQSSHIISSKVGGQVVGLLLIALPLVQAKRVCVSQDASLSDPDPWWSPLLCVVLLLLPSVYGPISGFLICRIIPNVLGVVSGSLLETSGSI